MFCSSTAGDKTKSCSFNLKTSFIVPTYFYFWGVLFFLFVVEPATVLRKVFLFRFHIRSREYCYLKAIFSFIIHLLRSKFEFCVQLFVQFNSASSFQFNNNWSFSVSLSSVCLSFAHPHKVKWYCDS
jgi:hypothetical protein